MGSINQRNECSYHFEGIVLCLSLRDYQKLNSFSLSIFYSELGASQNKQNVGLLTESQKQKPQHKWSSSFLTKSISLNNSVFKYLCCILIIKDEERKQFDSVSFINTKNFQSLQSRRKPFSERGKEQNILLLFSLELMICFYHHSKKASQRNVWYHFFITSCNGRESILKTCSGLQIWSCLVFADIRVCMVVQV